MTVIGYVPVDGGDLYVERSGSGPYVVLVHAGIADLRMWRYQVPALEDAGYRVLRYDVRGFGRSRSQAVPYRDADDLLRLLDDEGADQAVLVGNSNGGRIVLDTVLAYPDRVRGIGLIGSAVRGFSAQPTPVERALEDDEARESAAGDWEALAETDVRTWVDGPGQPPTRVAPAVRALVKAMAMGNYATFALEHPTPEQAPTALPAPAHSAELLGACRVPALVAAGTLDMSSTRSAAEMLAATLPQARLSWVEDAAHLLPLEVPDAFNALLLPWLREAAPVPA